jgi:DNA-binding GntR family transcriptional regulator
MILNGVLAPGTRVRDSAIAHELGVSRTPVREALVRLAEQGFLRADAGRGFTVQPRDVGEVVNTYPILASLECLALRLSGPIPRERIEQLNEINARLDLVRHDLELRIELDKAWHHTLLEGCPNKRLLALIDSLKEMWRIFEYDYARSAPVAISTGEHAQIADALSAGDLKTALKLLEANWRPNRWTPDPSANVERLKLDPAR